MASRPGPAKPRGSTWNGAVAWLIFSQSRQLNFSRTSQALLALAQAVIPGRKIERVVDPADQPIAP